MSKNDIVYSHPETIIMETKGESKVGENSQMERGELCRYLLVVFPSMEISKYHIVTKISSMPRFSSVKRRPSYFMTMPTLYIYKIIPTRVVILTSGRRSKVCFSNYFIIIKTSLFKKNYICLFSSILSLSLVF